MRLCFLSAPVLGGGIKRTSSISFKSSYTRSHTRWINRRSVRCSVSEPPTPTPAPETKAESPLSKLFSSKVFKSATSIEGPHAAPLVLLRVAAGLLMIHHGSEGGLGPANIGTPEFNGFVDYIMKPYFSALPGSPVLWAALHDYVEFFGGILLVFGAFTRPVSLALTFTMGMAVYFHIAATGLQGFPLGHVPNYSYDFEETALYLFIYFTYFFNGAGALSIDNIIYNKLKDSSDK